MDSGGSTGACDRTPSGRCRSLVDRIVTDGRLRPRGPRRPPAGRRRVVRVIIDARRRGDPRRRRRGQPGDLRASSTPPARTTRRVRTPYTLEVTSPGVGRPLTLPRHFRRARTRLVAAGHRRRPRRSPGTSLGASDDAVAAGRRPQDGAERDRRAVRRHRPGQRARSSSVRRPRRCATGWASSTAGARRRPDVDDDATTTRPTTSDAERDDGDQEAGTDERRHRRAARGGEGKGHRVRLADRHPGDRAAHAPTGTPRATPGHARVEIDRKTGADPGAGRRRPPTTSEPIGVVREWDDTPEDFGRIAATTARQVILQRLRDVDNERTFGDFAGREHDLITGTVSADAKVNARGVVVVSLGDVEGIIPAAEQSPGETYTHGQRLRCYVGLGRPGARADRRSPCPAPIRTWCASCSRSRSRRSPTARWRSPRSPGRPVTGRRSRCGRRCRA